MLIIWLFFLHSFLQVSFAENTLCDYFDLCPNGKSNALGKSKSRKSPTSPTSGSTMASNPALVDLEQKFGIEVVNYRHYYEVNIVTGTGFIGAGISTSRSEGSFFGNHPIEREEVYRERTAAYKKFRDPKFNFSIATSLLRPFGASGKYIDLSLGGMIRYNRESQQEKPGVGINLTLGPFNFGVSRYSDDYFDRTDQKTHEYQVTSFNGSFLLGPVAMGYAHYIDHTQYRVRTQILSSSLLLYPVVITYASRWENYMWQRHLFTEEHPPDRQYKRIDFVAVQFGLGQHFMMGIFYNYYMLKRYSFSLSLFF